MIYYNIEVKGIDKRIRIIVHHHLKLRRNTREKRRMMVMIIREIIKRISIMIMSLVQMSSDHSKRRYSYL